MPTAGSASTKTSDRKKAIKIAEQYEQVAQRRMPARTVRETLAELYREIYNESLPTATVRGFTQNWLSTKEPEVAPATLAFSVASPGTRSKISDVT